MKISTIVIAKDAEKLIGECLDSISWADEIIVVDTGSKDTTIEIAEKAGAKIYKLDKGTFSDWRNEGAKKATGDWILYIDVDERVTPLLKKEILQVIVNRSISAFAIPRRNILLGHEMKHGGWWPDYVMRLIKKDRFLRWEGELHEQPVISGKVGKLTEPLIHITHRTLSEMVEKTNKWSDIEARLLFESGHPKMTWWRFGSAMVREFWLRAIKEKGVLDGVVGWVEIIYQVFSRFVTYAKLWELQVLSSKGKEK